MKNSNKMILAMLMLGSSVWLAAAQPSDDQRPPPPDGAPQDGAPPGGGPPEGGGPGGGPGPGMHRHHRPPPLPIVLALDTNHDGVIDANEIANATAALKTLDKNGDGQLTPDEYMPPRPPRGPGAGTNLPPVPPIVAALDLNGDGIIDANEIAQASESLKKLDKNGDGQLTREEFAPPPPRRQGGPGKRGQMGPPGGPEDGGSPGGPPPRSADAAGPPRP